MKISLISLPKNIAEGAIRKTVFKSPPVTHLWLSAILEQSGHVVDIIDALTEGKSITAVVEHLKQDKPDMVGFTVFTSAFHDVLYAAQIIKQALPETLTAVGGYHVNSIPEDFQTDYIDLIFIGEPPGVCTCMVSAPTMPPHIDTQCVPPSRPIRKTAR